MAEIRGTFQFLVGVTLNDRPTLSPSPQWNIFDDDADNIESFFAVFSVTCFVYR